MFHGLFLQHGPEPVEGLDPMLSYKCKGLADSLTFPEVLLEITMSLLISCNVMWAAVSENLPSLDQEQILSQPCSGKWPADWPQENLIHVRIQMPFAKPTHGFSVD